MPETSNLFIWYHAPRELEEVLAKWLAQVETTLGVRGELFVRETSDSEGRERTTFMEAYRSADEAFTMQLEELAVDQPWITSLISPRRCEAFKRVEQVKEHA